MSKQPRKYNRIIDFLDLEAPDLSESIKSCRAEYLLSPKKKDGIALLLPPLDNYSRKQISLLAKGNDADKKSAIKIISSLIIPQNLKNKDDSKHYNLSGDEVDLTEQNSKLIESFTSTLPLTIYDYTPPKTRKKHEQSKKTLNAKKAQQIRYQISSQIENDYARNMVNPTNQKNAFITATYSLLYHVMNKDEYYEDVFLGRMLPYISHSEIDFYFLLEPHRIQHSEDDYIVPTIVVEDWWKNFSGNTTAINDIYNLLNKHLSDPISDIKSLIYTNRIKLLSTIDECRYAVESNKTVSVADVVVKQYLNENMKNKYPEQLAALYKKNRYRKILEDELRYISFKQFTKIQTKFDVNEYEEWLSVIANYMHQEPSEKKLRLLKADRLNNAIDPISAIKEICTFVQSTCYMFIPMTTEESKEYNGVSERPDVDISEDVWCVHEILHNRILSGSVIKSTQLGPITIALLKSIYESRDENTDMALITELESLFS